MKTNQNQFLIAAVLALAVGSASLTWAFQRPQTAPLPDLDRRLAVPAPDEPLTVSQQAKLAELTARVPGLDVQLHPVLGNPGFVSSSVGFLSGPQANGLGIEPASVAAFPANDPHRAVKAFLNEQASLFGYGAEVLAAARVERDYVTADNGLRTVVWRQQLDGIPVYQAVIIGNITRQEELVNLTTYFVPGLEAAANAGVPNRAAVLAAPPVGPMQAIRHAAATLGKAPVAPDQVRATTEPQGTERRQQFTAAPATAGEVYVQLTWLPLTRTEVRLCWQVVLVNGAQGDMFLLLVDAISGEVLGRRNLTRHLTNATYRVYTSDSPSPFTPGWPTPNTNQPPLVPRSLLTISALDTNASPNGWINDADNETRGNNVDAFLDRDGDLQPDVPRPQGIPFRVFDFLQDLNTDPTNYVEASIVQLFYINNRFHDFMYGLGFTEAGGNFQVDNFGRGGMGQDPINAMTLWGEAFGIANNATMSTPPDGIPALMRMFVFDGPTPRRDSALDSEVILHEHTHGITERTLGGGIGVNYFGQSGAIHEGNSDFCSMSALTEPADDQGGVYPTGGYLTYDILYPFIPRFRENYYFGIRRYPYSTNLLKSPLTYKDIDPTQASTHPGVPLSPVFGGGPADEVHNAGEVWCIVLWEMRVNLVLKHGWTNGNVMAMKLLFDGMRLSVPNPNFLQLRDAILQADRVNHAGQNQLEIWRAFAKRGMGGSATSPPGSTCIGVVEAYDLPGINYVSTVVDDTRTGNGNNSVDFDECAELTIVLRNATSAVASNVVATLATTNLQVRVVDAVAAYPRLAPGDVGANLTPFRIYTTPEFVCGTPIWFELVMASTLDVRTNLFVVNSGFVSLNANRFDNAIALPIPDNNTNGVSSPLEVFGLADPIGKVTVSFHLPHTYTGELQVSLLSPDGTQVTLVRNRGGFGSGFGAACSPVTSRTAFDDQARVPIDQAFGPYVGTFRPEEPLSAFKGKRGAAVNGTWRLKVVDGEAQDVGVLQCWSLTLFPIQCLPGQGPCDPDLAVTVVEEPEPVYVHSNLTYTVTVTNRRLVEARGVVLTNVLPATMDVVSVTHTQGTYSLLNRTLRFNFGIVSNAAAATATIVVTNRAAGLLTNVFAVGATNGDLNWADNTFAAVTTVLLPTPVIVANRAELVMDANGNGGIEPDETVRVALYLRNFGTAGTTGLQAELLNGNGVTLSSGTENYGVLPAHGAEVAREFGFTATGVSGGTVRAVLQLSEAGQDLGTVEFQFTLGVTAAAFNNPAWIRINDATAATPYPSVIHVTNLPGVISSVTVSLSKVSHPFPDDLEVLLVGPQGQNVLLMSDAGGGAPLVSWNPTFDDTNPEALPDEQAITGTLYRPTDHAAGDLLPAPAPGGPFGAALNGFNGTDPNGVWRLFVADDQPLDDGEIGGGWTVNISTVVPVNAGPDLTVALTPESNTAFVGSPFAYTLNVHNRGTAPATDVVVSNRLPANATVLSVSNSQGNVTQIAGLLRFDFGTLDPRAVATANVVIRPQTDGTLTNQATAVAAEADQNITDNTATILTIVKRAADLAVLATAQPEPARVGSNLIYAVTVTNQGPNEAVAVRLAQTWPAFVTLVSTSSSFTTNATGQMSFELGTLAPRQATNLTVVGRPTQTGNLTNLVAVASETHDPEVTNNTVRTVSTVVLATPSMVAAGAALVGNADNAIDPGEAVTVDLALRNVGAVATTPAFAATLLTTNGVLAGASASQVYGVLEPGAPVTYRRYTFDNLGISGGRITATLELRDGTNFLGLAFFEFALARVQSFVNAGGIVIPSSGAASPYPSTIAVAGVTSAVTKVTATLQDFSHTYPEDVDVLLAAPTGQKSILMSDVGGGAPVSNLAFTFDGTATADLPATGPLNSGTFRPADRPPADAFPSPAPFGPYAADLSVFNGIAPNGNWMLFVLDDSGGDLGSLAGGWRLNIHSASAMIGSSDLVLEVTAATNQLLAGEALGLTVRVTNFGPAVAAGVQVRQLLPIGASLVASNSTGGDYHLNGRELVVELGSLPAGGDTTASISLRLTRAGTTELDLTVTANETDPNAANNAASLEVLVHPSSSGPVVNVGSAWKYWDQGTGAPGDWPLAAFNDLTWPSGLAPLGYGRSDLGTIVNGGSPTNRYLTTYFRQTFPVETPGIYSNLTLRVLRDDGVIVYLNGTEVFRNNLPAGTVDVTTLATSDVTGLDEQLYFAASLNPSLLVPGANVLAAEVHQSSATSPDLGFDLELLANAAVGNVLPEVTLASPADNAVMAAESLELSALASDLDGLVTRVEYFAGATKLGEATAPPYRVTWSNVAPGTYALIARATDNSAQAADSAPVTVTVVKPPVPLLDEGAVWRYLDNGLDQGSNWVHLPFDDSVWSFGQAELGFGDHPVTVLNPGPDTNRFTTYYFRKRFAVADPDQFDFLVLDLKRNDGAVVYLNGQEVFRSNMPTGLVTFATLASTNVSAADSEVFSRAFVGAEILVPGTNIVAVEVHQATPVSTNLAFDLRLSAFDQSVPLLGGPLVSIGSLWKYHDFGTNAGADWQRTEFDDSLWSNGSAMLGYGRADIATVVNGGSPTNRFVTTYFRHSFNVQYAGLYQDLNLRILRDDGAIVYLNGVEIYRGNLPAGPATETNLALAEVAGVDENSYFLTPVNPRLLNSGINVLAVQLHPASLTNLDLAFDLELTGNTEVFNLPALQAYVTDHELTFSWPAVFEDYVLETSDQLGPAAEWVRVLAPVGNLRGWSTVTLTATPGQHGFYRLRRQ